MGHINGLITPEESMDRFVEYLAEEPIQVRKSDIVGALNVLLYATTFDDPELQLAWAHTAITRLVVVEGITVKRTTDGRMMFSMEDEKEE